MSRNVRVGVVGCGEVAQIIHLPTLRDLPELFEVVALCDVSPIVLEKVGAQWPAARRYLDHRDIVADSGVDALVIANPHVYHAAVALDAMRAGKHVLIEKPMCVNLAEADALLEREAQSGTTAQVGFMRRYAAAFLEAVDRLSAIRSEVILARVHDVIGANQMIIDSTSTVARDPNAAAALAGKLETDMAAATALAIGAQPSDKMRAYGLLLGLSSHDVSAMRELLGRPEKVLYAAQRHGGRAITAAFDYGGYVCQFETAVDRIPHFDAHIEVSTETQIIRIDYDTPYVRHLPARLTVTHKYGTAGAAQSSSFPTRYDSFGAEWREFHRNIAEGRKPKTSIADAREDLEIFRDMIALMT
jgi:predicted dehydrogenase